MKRLVVATLSASLLLPALAQANDNITVSQPISTPQTDLSAVFSASGDDLQIVALSDKEMEETEGAVLQFAPAILGGARVLMTGFTRHGLNQAISRGGVGVSNKAILNTMRDPKKIINQPNGTTKFVGKDTTVVLNQEGKVVTTWGKPR